MDTPDREARSLPHSLSERNVTTIGKQWVCTVQLPGRNAGTIEGVGKTVADATTDAASKLKAAHPGYTL